MDFHVSLAAPGDRADRIYRAVRDAICDGRLRAGERLPASREMARRLDVARNTVSVAYDRLIAEGFVEGRVGSGTFVCADPPRQARARSAPAGRPVTARPIWGELADENAPVTPTRYPFAVGVPDARLFPLQTWRRLVSRELRSLRPGAEEYADPAGHRALRAAIARHIGAARSVVAGADDVLVTNGAQQALDLIGRVLVGPGDVVAVEEPGYPPARRLFASLGARVVGVPVDDEGIDVAALPDRAKLVYTTPSHQFPLGVAMSLPRRSALLAWAERRGAVVVEDDYDSEFRFSDRPLEPLQSLDAVGRVVYVGSFSKILLPSLRLGFLIAPASLRTALTTARQLSDWHGDLIAQRALAAFMDDGLLARHVRKASREYAARHALVCSVVSHDLPWLRLIPSNAGLHVCARRAPGSDADIEAVVARARTRGVGIRPLSRFAITGPAHQGVVIGYGTIQREDIVAGLRELNAVALAR